MILDRLCLLGGYGYGVYSSIFDMRTAQKRWCGHFQAPHITQNFSPNARSPRKATVEGGAAALYGGTVADQLFGDVQLTGSPADPGGRDFQVGDGCATYMCFRVGSV